MEAPLVVCKGATTAATARLDCTYCSGPCSRQSALSRGGKGLCGVCDQPIPGSSHCGRQLNERWHASLTIMQHSGRHNWNEIPQNGRGGRSLLLLTGSTHQTSLSRRALDWVSTGPRTSHRTPTHVNIPASEYRMPTVECTTSYPKCLGLRAQGTYLSTFDWSPNVRKHTIL